MNRAETIQIIAYLAGNYQEIKTKKDDEKEFMINAWLDCLKDYDYNIVMKAVKELMTSNMFIPKLAEIINLTKQYKRVMIDNAPKLNAGKCDKCNEEGLIFYKKIVNKVEYQYVARCTCVKGNEFTYDGRIIKDEKHRSNYYVPTLKQIGI